MYYQDWIDDETLPTPDIISFPSNKIVFPPINQPAKDGGTAKLQNDNGSNIMQYWSYFDDNDMWETFNNLQMESNGKIIFQGNSHLGHVDEVGNPGLNRDRTEGRNNGIINSTNNNTTNGNNLNAEHNNDSGNLHSPAANFNSHSLSNIETELEVGPIPNQHENNNLHHYGNNNAATNNSNSTNGNHILSFDNNLSNPTIVGSVFDTRTMSQIENRIQSWQFSLNDS